MSVSWSLPIDARLQAAAVRQVDGDAIRPVDDVMVRQDAAVGVDDEAGAGAAAVRVVGIAALGVAPPASEVERRVEVVEIVVFVVPIVFPLAASRLARRVDADDGGVDALDDVGEVDGGAGQRRRAPRGRPGGRVGAGTADDRPVL